MMNNALPKALLFDLDGTLANTILQLAIAASKAAIALNIAPPSIEETKGYVGNGVNMLLARVIKGKFDIEQTDVDPVLLQKARAVFNQEYLKGLDKDYELYEGVTEGLEYFKSVGIKLAVVTNKPQMFAIPLLKCMGISKYFDYVLAGEVIDKRKPDPKPIFYTLEQLKVDKNSAWMIGDSDNDIIAANNAGITSVFFTYGYNRGDSKNMHFDYKFDTFSQLTDLIKKLQQQKV